MQPFVVIKQEELRMLSDIEIAQAAEMKPITEIAAKLGLQGQSVIPYGHYKANPCHGHQPHPGR